MPRAGRITGRVLSTVADEKGVTEEDLPPLYNSIDAEAVEELFNHVDTHTESHLTIQFSYAGCEVTIEEPGEVSVNS